MSFLTEGRSRKGKSTDNCALKANQLHFGLIIYDNDYRTLILVPLCRKKYKPGLQIFCGFFTNLGVSVKGKKCLTNFLKKFMMSKLEGIVYLIDQNNYSLSSLLLKLHRLP